jgi:hypothetical protein
MLESGVLHAGVRKTWMIWRGCRHMCALLLAVSCVRAQDSILPNPAEKSVVTLASPSLSEKWNFFIDETATPLTLVAATLDATASQLTRSAPLYGKHPWKRGAFPKRLAATLTDDISQNFFSDFLLASAFHQDTRYYRAGSARKIWPRIGYAISRALITRTDSGEATFNSSTVLGCAMSAGLSNAYYPPVSRTVSDSLTNWGTNVAGAGLTNLAPEFGPDVARWFKRHLPFHH